MSTPSAEPKVPAAPPSDALHSAEQSSTPASTPAAGTTESASAARPETTTTDRVDPELPEERENEMAALLGEIFGQKKE